MMFFNKYKNLFKGILNVVEVIFKEEEIYGKFGIVLYEILCDEYLELFIDEFFVELKILVD